MERSSDRTRLSSDRPGSFQDDRVLEGGQLGQTAQRQIGRLRQGARPCGRGNRVSWGTAGVPKGVLLESNGISRDLTLSGPKTPAAPALRGRRSHEICQDLTDRRRDHNPRVGVRIRGGLIRSGGCSTLGAPLTVSTIPFSSRRRRQRPAGGRRMRSSSPGSPRRPPTPLQEAVVASLRGIGRRPAVPGSVARASGL